MKYLLASCAALALGTGFASAATILEADFSGEYSTFAPPGSPLSVSGSVAGNAYYDLAPVRDYTIALSAVLESTIPGATIPFSYTFTWTGSITSLLSLTPFDASSGFVSLPYGIIGTYANYNGSIPGAFEFDFTVDAPGTIRDEFVNMFQSFRGSYEGNIVVTAAVPLPASLPLALGGVGLLGFMASRRKKQAETV